MSKLYSGIGKASKENMILPHPSEIPAYDDYVSVCQQMVEFVESISATAKESAAKGTDYQSFGVSGNQGASIFAPMFWSAGCFPHMLCRLINAQTGFILSSFNEVIDASNYLTTLYVGNVTSNGVYNKVNSDPNIANIVNLSWGDIKNNMPPVDFAEVGIWHLVDDDLFDSVVGSVKPGGLLVLTNASNGSELYNLDYTSTFAQSVHDKINARGDFSAFHMQGYISFTLFIKNI